MQLPLTPSLRATLTVFTLSALLTFLGCQEDDPTPTDLLTVSWELDDFSGDDIGIDPADFDTWEWEFQSDGDFEWRLLPNGNNTGAFIPGEWEFGNTNQTELIIEFDLGNESWEFELDIDELTSERLELDGTLTVTDGSNNTDDFDVELEYDRID